ncbi:MAG: serine protease [Betaproteobacteria bacterium]|nr:serine protease [Betaproteobacteria bacterium]
MKRAALYSNAQVAPKPEQAAPEQEPGQPQAAGWRTRMHAFAARRSRMLLFIGGVLLAGLPVAAYWALQTPPQVLTQDDIDDAVVHTMETKSLPSRSARAANAVRESVVRVRGVLGDVDDAADDKKDAKGKADAKGPAKGPPKEQAKEQAKAKADRQAAERNKLAEVDPPKAAPTKPGDKLPKGKPKPDGGLHDQGMSIGSGVVIVDKGVILTNNHVIAGAKRVFVTFFDGMESEADLVAVFPENDLAVLRARKIPDDLPAATLGSSKRLKPGDEVVAVGFPFDIGPSVSTGVVSGLDREFRSPTGEHVLTHMIQFDAAANSGNSGGPLVTMDGEVVGIVTAILNPHGAGTFIGIGFAVTIEGAGSAVGIPPF